MLVRLIKYGTIGAGVVVLGGSVFFGPELFSYAKTSVGQVRQTAKEAVPLDFELARARDLLGEILPELQANVRLIAQEEVEIEQLRNEIGDAEASLGKEERRIAKVRGLLDGSEQRFVVAGVRYAREDLSEDLSRSFDRYREAEIVLAGKQKLLDTRERTLASALRLLEDTRARKLALEDQIAALESQYRLVKAAGSGSRFQIDDTKIAQTDRLIRDIKKRLDVAERALAHEAQFTAAIAFDEPVDESELLTQIDEYFTDDEEVAGVQDEVLRLSRDD
ncbi:MAG: hypothetical protein AAGE65_14205 [Planctomycetota bacterium]